MKNEIKNFCGECVHAPICEYCADHLKEFALPVTEGCCDMYKREECFDTEEACDNADRIMLAERHPLNPSEGTIEDMISSDYKKRFKAEYAQTKIRYERLKTFNTKIEAARRTEHYCGNEIGRVEMPKHDCPDDLLREQQSVMGQYLHLLEMRAVMEGIDLSPWL